MMTSIFFIPAILVPWLLGFAILRPLLKQRYGYRTLAIGGGYLVGWCFTVGLLWLGDGILHRSFSTLEIFLLEAVIALPILFFLKARPCTIEEFRLEKAPSNIAYMIAALIILLLLYRWGLTAIELTTKPVYPWEGGQALADKARLLFQQRQLDEYPAAPLDFMALMQTYTAMAWGSWNDNVVNLPWLGLGIAMTLTIFGGLRYLGARLLPAFLAAYAVVSLPMWDSQLSLGASSGVWLSFVFTLCVIFFIIALVYGEVRAVLPLAISVLALYLITPASLIFCVALAGVLVWRMLGALVTTAALAMISFAAFSFSDGFMASQTWLTTLFSSADAATAKSLPTAIGVQWGLLDNWHYAFIATIGACLLFVFRPKNNQAQPFFSLFVAGAVSMLIVVTMIASAPDSWMITRQINSIVLIIMPVFVLVPFSVYHLVNKDDETIPPI